jgi:hypothetical protein
MGWSRHPFAHSLSDGVGAQGACFPKRIRHAVHSTRDLLGLPLGGFTSGSAAFSLSPADRFRALLGQLSHGICMSLGCLGDRIRHRLGIGVEVSLGQVLCHIAG